MKHTKFFLRNPLCISLRLALLSFVVGMALGCGDGSNDSKPDSTIPTEVFDWAYRREIELTGAASGLQMLVRLPEGVRTKSQPDGSDIRFSTDGTGETFNLTHYIEDWENGIVWVKLLNDTSTIYLFYGNENAVGEHVSFATMFPNAEVITSASTLTGDVSYEHLIIATGGIGIVGVNEEPHVLRIKARKIVLEGTISGTGSGYANTDESDPGQGGDAGLLAGGGGGGYGGDGGGGGETSPPYIAGLGGNFHGDTWDLSIEMGSSGGNGSNTANSGGRGGGAVWLDAQMIVVNGTIEVNGAPGVDGSSSHGGGGGAGGGILLSGNCIEVGDTAVFSAVGGVGGSPNTHNAGGGGGGGGRVKIFYDFERLFSDLATIKLDGGDGGIGTVSGQGATGESGTSAIEERFTYPEKAVVGEETPL